MSKPLLLDLFCCAGGAATGYYRAGFDIVGVDISPQPRYPFPFVQADALGLLDTLLDGWHFHAPEYGMVDLSNIAVIHTSPPCQGYSITASVNPRASEYPKLIGPVRDRLVATGKPYVIENVEGAKAEMINPVTLCGSQFGKRTIRNGSEVHLRRHRLFEANFIIPEAGPHNHTGRAFPVFGHGVGGKKWPSPLKGPGAAQFARDLMGINWANRHELDEAIPPAYTEYIGNYLIQAVSQPVAA